LRLARPLHDVDPGALAPAFHCTLEPARFAVDGREILARSVESAASIHRNDDALTAEGRRAFGDECWPGKRAGVDRNLVRARTQGFFDVLAGADAAAHSQGDEHLVGHS